MIRQAGAQRGFPLARAALLAVLFLTFMVWAPSAALAASFSAPTNFATGATPRSVAVGHFNGDSDLDLAIANSGSNNVSILLGGAGGSFGAATNVAIGFGSGPHSVAAGDFNGDSDPDLAVANLSSNNVSILLGAAGGTFTGPTNFAAGTGPISVAVGNFNGDSDLDLAVANNFSNNVSILLGAAGGTFTGPTNFAAGTGPFSVAAGDFNGDSDPDLAVANFNSNTVSVLLGGAGGSFGAAINYVVGTTPASVAAGDFNGDLDPDLAVANIDTDNVSILIGGAGGTFTGPTNFAVGDQPISVAVGNFDGDSDPDLAVANFGSNNVSVLLGGSGASFTAPTNFNAGTVARSVAVGDFDGDAEPDLAVANQNSANVSILLGSGVADLSLTKTGSPDPVTAGNQLTYTLTAKNNGPRRAGPVSLADTLPASAKFLSASSSQGLCNHSAGTVSCALGDLANGAQATVTISVAATQAGTLTNSASVSYAEDSNSSNNSDTEQTQVSPRAPPVFTGPTNFAAGNGPFSVAAGDFNGDLDPDLAVANIDTDNVSILIGGVGGTFTGPTNFAVGDQPVSVAVGNFDGDSDPDLAVANQNSNNVSILLGGAGATFIGPTDFAVGANPSSVAVGNFDGDSDPDLAVANTDSNNVSVLLGAAGGTFIGPTNFAVGSAPTSVAVGNFDGDLDPDLAVGNQNSNNVSVLLGGAGGSFGGATNYAVGTSPVSVAAGDFNGDSDPDLAVANSGSYISILVGEPGGSFGAATNFGIPTQPGFAAVGEFNGDSDPDLAVVRSPDTVSILLGGAGATFTEPTDFLVGLFPTSVAIGNFNGDSNQDLAVSTSASGNVSILLGAPPAGVVVVRKDAVPNDPQNFSFTAGGGLTPTSFQLDDDSDGTLSNTRTFTNVTAGSGYSLAEAVPAGWYQGAATCDDGSPVTNISVSAGETVNCKFTNSTIYARPGSASPLRIPLVPRYQACTLPNSTHVAPKLSPGPGSGDPSCTPTALESSQLTTSTVGRGAAFLKLTVIPGNPGTPADEADIALQLTVSDVLAQSGGADYVGKTILRMAMRITDRANDTAGVASATVQDTSFAVPVDCVSVSGVFGSNCNLTTTLDALEPGTAKEGKRAIMSMLPITLEDAGPNGTIAPVSDPSGLGCPPTCGDGDEKVFLEQGMFTP